MIEIPEGKTLERQAKATLCGKRIQAVHPPTSLHKFAWFSGDPAEYGKLLKNKTITGAKGHGMYVDLHAGDDITVSIGDGAIIRYLPAGSMRPEKYQLLIDFDDGSMLVFTVAMYGGIWAVKGSFDNKYYQGSLNSVSPLEPEFEEKYFAGLLDGLAKKNISAKAFLATEQRIPGLGNGSLHDILLLAGIHPKKKITDISDREIGKMFGSVKSTLKKMTDGGGKDTEKDLYGNPGGYKTLLSKNTYASPCPLCGDKIVKEAYLGGAVYYCPSCQKL